MRRVVAFFLLAYALTWAGWFPLVARALGWTDASISPYLHLVASLGPALAAFIMVAIEGPAPLRRLARRCIHAPPRWIAIALLAPIALFAIAAGALLMLGFDVDLRAIGTNAEYPNLPIWIYVLANVACYGLGEEIGWRGFALPRLQATMSATRASLVVAIGWALWHAPLFIFAGMASMGPAEVFGWIASIIAGSFLMTALFNASGGSILAVAIFHGVLDVLITSPTGGPLQTAMGALVTFAGLTLPFRFGRANLAPNPRVIEP